MPRAQSADGVFHDFPEGTDPAVIDRVMRDYAKSRPTAPEKTYYNDAGQPFTLSGKPAPQQKPDSGYTGSILPFRRDDAGLHFAVPEAIASPARGIYEGGKRASGDAETGQNPLRPLSPDIMSAVGLAVGASPASRLGPAVMPDKSAAITSAYNRGIKPTTTMTAPQGAGYDANVRQAVDAIIDVRGRKSPQTVEDFSSAVAETKASVYQRYSSMAQEAEQKGARVPLGPAAERLQKLADDPMQDPAAVAEAKRLLALIPGKNASIAPSRAEEVLRHLNERATGFDTLGTKGAGSVFREAAGALRGALVDAVHGAGFPEYGKLRQTYGSLVAIEDDVGRATGRSLNKGSSIGLTEAIAVGETAMGSPTAGLATQAMKWLSQRLKSSDRATRELFREAQRAQRPVPAGAGLGKAVPTAAAATPSTAGSADDELTRALGLLMYGKSPPPVSPP
jgi:hypothetical protein